MKEENKERELEKIVQKGSLGNLVLMVLVIGIAVGQTSTKKDREKERVGECTAIEIRLFLLVQHLSYFACYSQGKEDLYKRFQCSANATVCNNPSAK